jgi:hypothetical protein
LNEKFECEKNAMLNVPKKSITRATVCLRFPALAACLAIVAGCLPAASARSPQDSTAAPAIVRLDPRFDDLVAPDAVLEKIADGIAWADGPVWNHPNGFLLFSDLPNNSIFKWEPGKGLSLFLKPSGYTGAEPFEGREPLAQVLCRYTAGMDGPLFTSLKGKLLDQRSALNELHTTGKRGGFHIFRRFRFAALRKARMPDHLIKLWMGHSQNLMDRYAAQLDMDITGITTDPLLLRDEALPNPGSLPNVSARVAVAHGKGLE